MWYCLIGVEPVAKKIDTARFAPAFVILGAGFWGLIGLFTKPLSAAGMTTAGISFARGLLGAVMLFAFLAVFDREKLRIRLRDTWLFIGTGILSLVFFSIMYFMTQREAGLSVAAVLLYTAPFFVIIMSAIFFREKITGRTVLSLVIAAIGCVCTAGLVPVLLRGGAGRVSVSGILTGVGSGFGYALYSIFANQALKKYHSVTVTAYTLLFSALALAPFCLRGEFIALYGTPGVWQASLGIALVATICPYVLYTFGLKYTKPGSASVMAFSEPAVATVIGVLVFGESLTPDGVVGLLFIFAALIILNTGKKK
jgi:drug/metabolite transporter (DMT)-like permease